MIVKKLNRNRVLQAKRAFTTRRVRVSDMRTLIHDVRPQVGDLVLATVDLLGKHKRIEFPNGRRSRMVPGDEIIVCYGNRYAPDQFEAIIGSDLAGCDLVAGGGMASREICRHERMQEPTRILPIGLVGNGDGKCLNLSDYAVEDATMAPSIDTVLVLGTSMNAGKTITAASLIKGFKAAGLKVAGIKATGTGSGGDLWHMSDMGADIILDFTDGGLPGTYMVPSRKLEQVALNLITHAAEAGCDVAVVEIADGLQHEETATLLRSKTLRQQSKGVVFAASDALGAMAGVEILSKCGHKVFAISGQLTRSPLAIRETEKATRLPVVSPLELQAGVLCELFTGQEAENVYTSISVPENIAFAPPELTSSTALIAANGSSTRRIIRASETGSPDPFKWLQEQQDEGYLDGPGRD